MTFHLPSFLLGVLLVAVIVLLVPLLAPLLAMRSFNAVYGVFFRRRFHKRPQRIRTASDLQPYVKALAKQRDERTLFVRSEAPEFTIQISNRVYKKRPSLLILEVRNIDANRGNYEVACAVLQNQGPEFEEKLSPRAKRRSRARIKVEIDTYAPSAITSATRAVFEGIGMKTLDGLLVSDLDPCLWPKD